MKDNMRIEIERKQTTRFKLLNSLYKESGGKTKYIFNASILADDINIGNTLEDIYVYLVEAGFIADGKSTYKCSITHLGIRVVEKAHRFPDEASEYFPSLNEMDI